MTTRAMVQRIFCRSAEQSEFCYSTMRSQFEIHCAVSKKWIESLWLMRMRGWKVHKMYIENLQKTEILCKTFWSTHFPFSTVHLTNNNNLIRKKTMHPDSIAWKSCYNVVFQIRDCSIHTYTKYHPI